MAEEIKIPQIAEGVESATVTEILVSEGDEIEKDQSVITVESDKASVEIPSPKAGTVKSIELSEGDEVKVGDVILSLETSEEDSEEKEDKDEDKEEKEKKKKKEEQEKKDSEEEEDSKDQEKEEESKEKKEKKDKKERSEEEEEKDDEEKDADEDDKSSAEEEKAEKEGSSEYQDDNDRQDVPAAPGVRRFARELGVDISQIKGSGEQGRISKEDVKEHARTSKSKKASGTSGLPDFSKWGQTERKPLSGIRSATARNTAAAWSEIPHVFQFDEADISGILEYIEENKEKAEKAGGQLTITAVLIKVVGTALHQFPKFNASIDMETEEMILKSFINIGIAVDTEKGLLIPVIKDVDQKTIVEIAVEITELAEKARNRKLTPEEMKGGNFTISNLGGIGGTNFTPIIYHPQVAILGVSRAQEKPVFVNGNFEPRKVLPLSLSYDHRLIDGAEGVKFLTWISKALEDPYKALLGA